MSSKRVISRSLSSIMAPWKQNLDVLQSAVKARPPFCSGVVPLEKPATLWYTKPNQHPGLVNYTDAGIPQLDELVQACDPATFGRAQENVYDETYRKAWKLDAKNFATNFDPVAFGIIATIRERLLEGRNQDRHIKTECYNLNVYSEGSFFKAHKDTPRGGNMFGSLVVVLPTTHEGGSLVLRHSGKEWAFDFAKILPEQPSPSVGFIAYFSDVEHEVLPVASGHRVTLTYNLYFEDKSDQMAITKGASDFLNLKAALANLLDNETFLPEGGYLAFGLHHMYPIKIGFDEDNTDLGNLLGLLKGTDAMLKDVCDALSLQVSLQVFVETVPEYEGKLMVMLPRPYNFSEFQSEAYDFLEESGGKVVYQEGQEALPGAPGRKVVFVNKGGFTEYKSVYIAYGNLNCIDYMYGHVYLVAEVGKPGSRNVI